MVSELRRIGYISFTVSNLLFSQVYYPFPQEIKPWS